MEAAEVAGSARRWGELWGARARDWAGVEEQQLPAYEEAVRRAGIRSGTRVLDVGCGTGVFLRVAADRGAEVAGLDASTELLDLARQRVPEADLRSGNLESLPYDDDSFDVVAGFNSFFFADDMVVALREAGRVAKPGAPVVAQVWGRPQACDLEAMKGAIRPFLPPSPAGASPPAPLWKPGALERLAREAGLDPEQSFDVSSAYEFPNEERLARSLLSPALAVKAIAAAGEAAVREAIVAAMAPFRTADGGYRLENEWHFSIARA